MKRPLDWRHWLPLLADEQARLRWCLMDDLRDIDGRPDRHGAYHWRQTHRQLLELKAASGHNEKVEGNGC
jgi:hypothetical protein